MELDLEAFRRARLSRDARFDGRFFIGVKTTGIYCRPICPAPAPHERNVLYFATAAAAAEAGFRPCLRCRPESSPGTPAWVGTSSTVSRALRLIGESGLEDTTVEELAERLGVGSRHLRRLFLQHVGAAPLAVIQTRRLHFAKKLIDETRLPYAEIALASGFRSVRRFNATFQKLYARTPTELRGLARNHARAVAGLYRVRLGYRSPFDWDGLLEFLAARAIPGVEVVEGGVYRRTIALDGRTGTLAAAQVREAVELTIHFPEPRALIRIVERVRRMFDLDADPAEIHAHLRRDRMLARRVAARPGLRVPGAWDGFELAVRAVLGQQITVKGATLISGRLVRAHGVALTVSPAPGLTHVFPTPAALTLVTGAAIGVPAKRGETIAALARAVEQGRVVFESHADPERCRAALREVPGIGEWTAQYVAMRALGEPDAFPSSDLGLLKAAGMEVAKQLEQRAEAWRPWRAYAALHLWQGGERNGKDTLHLDREPRRRAAAIGR